MRFWCYSWRLPFSQVAEGNVVGRREPYRFSIPTLAIEFKSATVIMLVFHFNLIQFDEGVRPDEIISKFDWFVVTNLKKISTGLCPKIRSISVLRMWEWRWPISAKQAQRRARRILFFFGFRAWIPAITEEPLRVTRYRRIDRKGLWLLVQCTCKIVPLHKWV